MIWAGPENYWPIYLFMGFCQREPEASIKEHFRTVVSLFSSFHHSQEKPFLSPPLNPNFLSLNPLNVVCQGWFSLCLSLSASLSLSLDIYIEIHLLRVVVVHLGISVCNLMYISEDKVLLMLLFYKFLLFWLLRGLHICIYLFFFLTLYDELIVFKLHGFCP